MHIFFVQVDTLRLAINYIEFLKELIETTKLDDDALNEKKVIICCSQQSPVDNSPPVTGHSLSWHRKDSPNGNIIVTSSIWIPEPGEITPDD